MDEDLHARTRSVDTSGLRLVECVSSLYLMKKQRNEGTNKCVSISNNSRLQWHNINNTCKVVFSLYRRAW